ncbi:MAG: hypothetical protein HY247_02845 [archaeon]|nr:MAG: hypothetical protein HY247_02845 [archaeon]
MILFVPIGISHATITGNMVLGHVNPAHTVYAGATNNVTVVAGSSLVTLQDNAVPSGTLPAELAIDFTTGPVTFTAPQFFLYISKNGFGNVNTTAGDIRYAGPFNVTDLVGAFKTKTFSGHTYYIGTGSTTKKLIIGPIPITISSAYAYIKIYDGSCGSNPTFCGGTGIAGALQRLIVKPGLQVTPSSGAAGTPATFMGGGFPAGINIFLGYSYTFYYWTNGTAKLKTGNIVGNFSTGPGYFNQSAVMLDTKQGVGGTGGPHATTVITFTAYKGNSPHTAYATTTFTESNRGFASILSYDSGGTAVDVTNSWVSGKVYANDTAITTSAGVLALAKPCSGPTQCVYAKIFGAIWIAGNWSYVSSAISFWINGTQVGSATSSSKGFFNGSLTVPTTLSNGLHNVKVNLGNNVWYNFNIWVLPTLVLTPSQGTASNPNTNVTLSAYGFPADIKVLIYWNSTTWNDGNWYNLVNGTTGSNGQFNGTVWFTVPETFGGSHNVAAIDYTTQDILESGVLTSYAVLPNNKGCFDLGDGLYEDMCEEFPEAGITMTPFTVVASLEVNNNNAFNNTGSLIQVVAEGLIPVNYYSVNIDNQMADFSTTLIGGVTSGTHTEVVCTTKTTGSGIGGGEVHVTCKTITVTGSSGSFVGVHGLVTSNPNGTAWLWIVAAGFRPGIHEISLTSTPENYTGSPHVYGPEVYDTFWVGTGNDTVYNGLSNQLSALSAMIASFSSTLSSIQSTVQSIQSSVNTLSASVTSLQASVTSISSMVTSIQSDVSSIKATVADISTSLGTGTSGITSKIDDLTTKVNSISTTLGQVQTSVNGLSGLSGQVTDTLNAANQVSTYVLVAIALSAITLVLALAILIRKLS